MTFLAHQCILRQFMGEVFEVNERILSGDICSNKTALPRVRKLCEHYAKMYFKVGCANIQLEPYIAAGGWVGITYSYDPPEGEPIVASCVPRRFP